MSVTVAKTAGFCFGVQRAYDLAMELVRSGRPACTYGELIHNPQIVSKLYKAGIPAIERVEDNIDRRAVIIRSHGVPPSVYHALAEMGARSSMRPAHMCRRYISWPRHTQKTALF